MRFLVLLFSLLVLIAACSSQVTPRPSAPTPNLPTESAGPADANGGTVREFSLSGKNFTFLMNGQAAPELRVKLGDTVRVNFTNVEGFHDFVIDEFGAQTPKLQAGGSAIVEFVADKRGAFEYYCSVGSHRQMGMRGRLIVE